MYMPSPCKSMQSAPLDNRTGNKTVNASALFPTQTPESEVLKDTYQYVDGYHHREDALLGSWQHHAHMASSCVSPCIYGKHDQPLGWVCQYDHLQQQCLKNTKNL